MSLLDPNSKEYKAHAISRLRERFYIALFASEMGDNCEPEVIFDCAGKAAKKYLEMEGRLL